LLSRRGTGTASRRQRPVLSAASSTLAWTDNSPARRVTARTRSTRRCGPPQRRHAAAVDELQARQVNDDPRLAGNGRRELATLKNGHDF
jgi:hypothetical protein